MPASPEGYRPCAGAVVFNDDGNVFVGRRSDLGPEVEYAWQFPQGGLDKGEDVEAGARRELYEETGIRSVSLLGQHDTWLTYDFPAEMQGKRFKRYRGQAQAWFAYAFTGDVTVPGYAAAICMHDEVPGTEPPPPPPPPPPFDWDGLKSDVDNCKAAQLESLEALKRIEGRLPT